MRRVWTVLAIAALAACGDGPEVTSGTVTIRPAPTPTSTVGPPTSSTRPVTTVPDTTNVLSLTSTTTQRETVLEPMDSSIPPPVNAADNVQTAIDDLRARLGDDEADVEVESVEEIDWPDGSIGCPQPGMVYTQAIVNGTKIVLTHAGIRYPYHQGGGRDVFYCPQTPSIGK